MDLSALNASLAGLGPWGIALGIALTIGTQYLKARLAKPAAAPTTAPDATQPAVAPVAPVSNTPILDALLGFIKAKVAKSAAPATGATVGAQAASDIDHATAADLLAKLFPPK